MGMHPSVLLLAVVLGVQPQTNATPVEESPTPVIIDDVFPVAGPPCGHGPDTEWGEPACEDYELDTSLIESAGRGDRSAIDLLERRYRSTATFAERHRIGAALLGRVADDSAIWNELSLHAGNAVRFVSSGSELNPELVAWCEERGCDPYAYSSMAEEALIDIADVPRARPLLLRAMKTNDPQLTPIGIYGLCGQRDESLLPAIDEALSKSPDASSLAMALAAFRSEAADRIAAKYISEDDREEYEEQKKQQEPLP